MISILQFLFCFTLDLEFIFLHLLIFVGVFSFPLLVSYLELTESRKVDDSFSIFCFFYHYMPIVYENVMKFHGDLLILYNGTLWCILKLESCFFIIDSRNILLILLHYFFVFSPSISDYCCSQRCHRCLSTFNNAVLESFWSSECVLLEMFPTYW